MKYLKGFNENNTQSDIDNALIRLSDNYDITQDEHEPKWYWVTIYPDDMENLDYNFKWTERTLQGMNLSLGFSLITFYYIDDDEECCNIRRYSYKPKNREGVIKKLKERLPQNTYAMIHISIDKDVFLENKINEGSVYTSFNKSANISYDEISNALIYLTDNYDVDFTDLSTRITIEPNDNIDDISDNFKRTERLFKQLGVKIIYLPISFYKSSGSGQPEILLKSDFNTPYNRENMIEELKSFTQEYDWAKISIRFKI